MTVERTKAAIDKLLMRYGSDQLMNGSDTRTGENFIQFRFRGYYIRIRFKVPVGHTSGAGHGPRVSETAVTQAARTRWRQVLLVVKARLESVYSGIETTEQAFLPFIVVGGGSTTVGDCVVPDVKAFYAAHAAGQSPPEFRPALPPHKPEAPRE